jgi:hypothetical protein
VGFEFEFAGLPPADAARVVAGLWGGQVQAMDNFQVQVSGSRWGDVKVEIDARLFTEKRFENYLSALGIELEKHDSRERMERWLLGAARLLVPVEITTPPLPLEALHLAEELRDALRLAKARGTGDSPLYAFGFQMNVEAADTSTSGLVAMLRAFLLLYKWIEAKQGINLTRRLSPFIDGFPHDFARMVVDPDYAPADTSSLVQDYLAGNPTRNRPLDMLPLFAWLDPDTLSGRLKEPGLVKPRPAFHYRLPDCRIDDPAWRVADEWACWLQVERLALDPDRMRKMADIFLLTHPFPLDQVTGQWADRVEEFLE